MPPIEDDPGVPELGDLRAQVRQLIAERGVRPGCDSWMRGFDREFSRAVAARGWIGMTWPREFGGGERSNTERLAVTEELLRAGAPVAAHWTADRQIGPAVLRYGSPGLREEFLPAICRGDLVFCLGMSETEAFDGAPEILCCVTSGTDIGDRQQTDEFFTAVTEYP
jgi:alkylation response protein AidB-like acyl-CoA dehydrogenase